MNNRLQRSNCLLVTGFPPDIDRRTLKNEFLKFGNIEKLFLENSGKFAKVIYTEKASCDLAVQELNNSAILNWQVQYFEDKYTKSARDNYKLIDKSSESSSSKEDSMARYSDNYEDEDFSENFEYCNVHGQPLIVLEADSGDLYVNLKDIRKTGFAIFRKDTFDSILIDKRQIEKEFELHLLSEAKNYILKNKVTVIGEEEILKTIERCRSKLLGETNVTGNRNNFGPGRSVTHSLGNNITVTADVHRISNSTSFSPPTINQRPPKSLPNNFMPTNTPRNEKHSKTKSQDRGPRSNQNISFQDNKELNNDSFVHNKSSSNGYASGSDTGKQNNFFDAKSIRKPRANIDHSNNKDQKKSQYVTEQISKLQLETGATYQTQIVYKEEKENICWVQKIDDVDAVEDILLQINEMEAELENVNPHLGQLVIAQFEGVWSRGQVVKVNPPIIHFIDYGNTNAVSSVKPLPDKFKKIPALAARLMINKTFRLNDSMTELNIRVKQQYEGGTYLVDLVDTISIHSEDENISKSCEEKKVDGPKQKCYFDIPNSISPLKNGDKVMIVDVEDNKFLVKTRECADKSKEISAYIKNLDKTALTLTNVKVGQLILCSKDGLVGLHRAVITKKESASVVTVKYIDFSGEDELSIKSLRNVDEFLANEPSSIILTPEYKGIKEGDEVIMDYISEICKNKEKFAVVISDGDFDLQFGDGTLLSEKLIELKSPKKLPEKPIENTPIAPKQTEKAEAKSERVLKPVETKITYNEMAWINIEAGPHSFICYHFNNMKDMTMISATDEVIAYLEKVTGLKVTDETPYKPQELEMCLVLYKGPEEDEATWFRAVVLSVEADDYDVTFVDFGNQETVKSKDIRKFAPDLKNIPMLGITCELVGIPDTPGVDEHLKELSLEGQQLDVTVKGSNDLKYQIEIPEIYKELKAKGLY